MSPASFCVFSFDFAIFYVHNLPLLHTSLDNFDALEKRSNETSETGVGLGVGGLSEEALECS